MDDYIAEMGYNMVGNDDIDTWCGEKLDEMQQEFLSEDLDY